MSKVSKDIWNREKDGSNREKRSFLRYFIIATAVCLVVLLVKKDGLMRMVGTFFTLRKQENRIEQIQDGIRDLEAQIETLSVDKDSLEALAREKYLFAVPGDDVYLVTDEQ